jgi:hypothetical protein
VKFTQLLALLQDYVNDEHAVKSIDELFPSTEFTKMCNTVFEFCESKPYQKDNFNAEYEGLLFIMYHPIITFVVFKAE